MSQTNPLSPAEREQLVQTIEMFGVIVQASPHDAQSLEILKDAFVRIGQAQDALIAARKLAEIFAEAEQYSRAVKEYEYILDHDPANVEVMAALGEIEEKMRVAKASGRGEIPEENVATIKGKQLIATGNTLKVSTKSAASVAAVTKMLVDDGNDALVKFLLLHRRTHLRRSSTHRFALASIGTHPCWLGRQTTSGTDHSPQPPTTKATRTYAPPRSQSPWLDE